MISNGGVAAALAAAALFGLSTPLAKSLVETLNPWMLAGMLYLGSGLGLALLRLLRFRGNGAVRLECLIQGRDWLWLSAAIVSGGVVGPVLLMFGLTATSASVASLLLNLEGVFTAVLAWCLFQEHYDRRLILGMVAITAGAALLTWTGTLALAAPWGPLAVAGACLAWGLDNNLSRKVALCDPVQIGMIKGLAAGAANLVIAWGYSGVLPDLPSVFKAGLLGFLGYGASLVLFMKALRQIGAARTGAYFSVAPFAGSLLGLILFREEVTFQITAAALLMAFGVWLHLTERHGHEHLHEEVYHEHAHGHGPHHLHDHDEAGPEGGRHSHWHLHFPLEHRHTHYPDPHHRHRH